MLNRDNACAVIGMLNHFGQSFAVIFDSNDEIIVTTDQKTIMHYVARYDCDRVNLYSPYGFTAILEDNNDFFKIIEITRENFHPERYISYKMVSPIVHSWFQH